LLRKYFKFILPDENIDDTKNFFYNTVLV